MANVSTTSMPLSLGRVLSGVFLVAGTCIGGGMLALPIATGQSGFIPSLIMMTLCWLAMTITALLLIEVSLWMEEGAHFISMSSRILGAPGKWISWCLYLFLCYAPLAAYTASGGAILGKAVEAYLGISLSPVWAAIIFLVLFGVLIDLGSQVIGKVNTVLFLAMMGAFFLLVGMGVDEVNPRNLLHRDWSWSLMALPLTINTFGFQTMVPSLTPYLQRHPGALRIAIIGGTTITLIVYLTWQWLILGIVPLDGANGLQEALQKGQPVTQFLDHHVKGMWITQIADFFAFFAIVTSFLGIGLGLVDFLSDGLKVEKKGWGKLFLGTIIVVPVLLIATQFERIFFVAMEISGGFGDAILNGMLPVAMVWMGRYSLKMSGDFRVSGGKIVLALTFGWFLLTFIVQFLCACGFRPILY